MSAIPSTLAYAPAPNAARAEAYQTSISPSNGTVFTGGQTVRLELPCGQSGMYLNNQQSYLSGAYRDTTAPPAAGQFPRGGASSCIATCSVWCGSVLLSRTRSYAGVRDLFRSLQSNRSDQVAGVGLLEGHSGDDRLGAATGVGADYRFCIPLFDPTIGPTGRHFPLGMVHSLRIELELVPPIQGVAAAASTGFQWSDVEFRASIIQLPAESERLVAAASGASTRSWNTTQHSVYTDYLPQHAGLTSVSSTIPARFSSCKSILTYLTPQTALAGAANEPTARAKAGMQSYFYNLNGKHHPMKAVDTRGSGSMAYAEVMRSLHAFASTSTHSTIGAAGYAVNASDDHQGQYVVGTELESFSHRSDAVFSGASTLAVAPRFHADLQCPAPMHMTHIVSHDAVYSIENGQCTVST